MSAACTNCRGAKVRCVFPADSNVCERCRRRHTLDTCVLERPQKRGPRSLADLQLTALSSVPKAPSSPRLGGVEEHRVQAQSLTLTLLQRFQQLTAPPGASTGWFVYFSGAASKAELSTPSALFRELANATYLAQRAGENTVLQKLLPQTQRLAGRLMDKVGDVDVARGFLSLSKAFADSDPTMFGHMSRVAHSLFQTLPKSAERELGPQMVSSGLLLEFFHRLNIGDTPAIPVVIHPLPSPLWTPEEPMVVMGALMMQSTNAKLVAAQHSRLALELMAGRPPSMEQLSEFTLTDDGAAAFRQTSEVLGPAMDFARPFLKDENVGLRMAFALVMVATMRCFMLRALGDIGTATASALELLDLVTDPAVCAYMIILPDFVFMPMVFHTSVLLANDEHAVAFERLQQFFARASIVSKYARSALEVMRQLPVQPSRLPIETEPDLFETLLDWPMIELL